MLLGLGFAFFASPNTNAIMSAVPRKFYGVASGSVGTMRLTGQMFSPAIALLVSALCLGSAQIVPENYPQFLMAMRAAFAVLAVLCGVGILHLSGQGRCDRRCKALDADIGSSRSRYVASGFLVVRHSLGKMPAANLNIEFLF